MRRSSLSVTVVAMSLASVGVVSQLIGGGAVTRRLRRSRWWRSRCRDLNVERPGSGIRKLAVAESTMERRDESELKATQQLGAALTGLGLAVQSNTGPLPPTIPTPTAARLSRAHRRACSTSGRSPPWCMLAQRRL